MQSLYSLRAADFHEIVTAGKPQDESALEHYLRLVRDHAEGAAIVDLGCGTGDVLNDLSTTLATRRVLGVDVVDEMLEIGRREAVAREGRRRGLRPEFLQSDMHTVVANSGELRGSFDLVISRWAYHCTKDLKQLFDVARSLLTPGGWHVFLSNVVYSSPKGAQIESYRVKLADDFSVTNQSLSLGDYLTALADNRFAISEMAFYSADHKIVKEPNEAWFERDGFPSTRVFTGVFASRLHTVR